jgi:PAS domain S-box-containing protein
MPAASSRAYFRTALTDISQRRAAEEKLERSRLNYQTVLDTIEGVVWEADARTLDITFVSQFAEKMLGYPVADWYRSGFWESHLYVDDREHVMRLLARPLSHGDDFAVEYRLLTAARQLVWVHDRISVRSRDGKLKLFGIAVDITERKRGEEQLRYAQEHLESVVAERTAQLRETVSDMEAFSYSLSHDMRAPLRAMQGYAQLLREKLAEKLEPNDRDYFARIMSSAQRLDGLIQDVLQYSRIARAPLEMKPVDLEQVVRNVIHDYPALQPPNASIDVQAPLLPVLGHEAFLTQCVSNLLSNAVKFVVPGQTPRVRIATQSLGPDVRVWFEDHGIGVERQDQKRIFGIFQRVHGPNRYEGTGIGLAIVQKAVERMGGRVGVESKEGQGSTFWLQLHRGDV